MAIAHPIPFSKSIHNSIQFLSQIDPKSSPERLASSCGHISFTSHLKLAQNPFLVALALPAVISRLILFQIYDKISPDCVASSCSHFLSGSQTYNCLLHLHRVTRYKRRRPTHLHRFAQPYLTRGNRARERVPGS